MVSFSESGFKGTELIDKTTSYITDYINGVSGAYSPALETAAIELRAKIKEFKKERDYLVEQARLGKEDLKINVGRGERNVALGEDIKKVKVFYVTFIQNFVKKLQKRRRMI